MLSKMDPFEKEFKQLREKISAVRGLIDQRREKIQEATMDFRADADQIMLRT